MATKVKGLLKGLRYISQIFDEKDQEIQIGFPTDVKHVAHIGWDGPSANSTPSWMTEFKSPQESTGQLAVKELSAQDINRGGLAIAQELVQMNEIPKSTSAIAQRKAVAEWNPLPEKVVAVIQEEAATLMVLTLRPPHMTCLRSQRTGGKRGSTDGGSTRSSRRPRSKGQNSLTDISLEGSEHGSPMHPILAGNKPSGAISAPGIRI
ncbi:hypothetical protein M0R45_018484 [Rubus argutus]|uniref:CRIB domain-containing protein n=1 Tax=Rubus argutus TaxID=59490 RepID=A0AAW1X3K4_RUBAR